MSLLSIFFIAISLSLDAFAVAVTAGATHRKMAFWQGIKIAVFFGFFQFVMPIIGWTVGFGLRGLIMSIDHWIAFGLLFLVGIKMLIEAFRPEKNEDEERCVHKTFVLFFLAIATSIDALVVGVSFAFLRVALIFSSLLIGLVTFLISLSGVYIGKRFGHLFENKVEIVGGLVLIAIGVKILLSHLI